MTSDNTEEQIEKPINFKLRRFKSRFKRPIQQFVQTVEIGDYVRFVIQDLDGEFFIKTVFWFTGVICGAGLLMINPLFVVFGLVVLNLVSTLTDYRLGLFPELLAGTVSMVYVISSACFAAVLIGLPYVLVWDISEFFFGGSGWWIGTIGVVLLIVWICRAIPRAIPGSLHDNDTAGGAFGRIIKANFPRED